MLRSAKRVFDRSTHAEASTDELARESEIFSSRKLVIGNYHIDLLRERLFVTRGWLQPMKQGHVTTRSDLIYPKELRKS